MAAEEVSAELSEIMNPAEPILPIRIAPTRTLSAATVTASNGPTSAIARIVATLANPGLSHGRGLGMNSSSIHITEPIAVRRAQVASLRFLSCGRVQIAPPFDNDRYLSGRADNRGAGAGNFSHRTAETVWAMSFGNEDPAV